MGRVTSYRLLGPLEVVRDGRPVDLGGPKPRALLATLLLDAGRVVSVDRLTAAVWGDRPPPTAASSLQVYVSNLRRALRDDEHATSPIVRSSPGYLIDVDPADVDVTRFTSAADAVRVAVDAADWDAAVGLARAALALWRGPLLVEHGDEDWVREAAVPLAERRSACAQDLVVGLLGSGQVGAALAGTHELVAQSRLDEKAWWLHALALHRAGRSPDALDAIRTYARELDDELGLDVGPALRDLQGAILRQDPDLASWPAARAGTTPPVVEPESSDPPAEADSARGDLVGRDREIAALGSALAEVRAGATRWIVLTGSAGIGKSRLAQEATALWRAGGGAVAWAGCPDDDGVPAWWPVRQLLRELGEPDAVLTPPTGSDADAARFTVYDRVRDVLAGRLATGPLLLVVEDVHWADPTTLRFLTFLAETGQLPGLAVVLTVRDATNEEALARVLAAAARRQGTRRLAVPPLTEPEVAELAASISGADLPPSELADLVGKTGGNPFFVGEYARLPPEERADGEVPAAVRSVLRRRIAGLDPVLVQVLQTAAVMTEPLDLALLSEVTRLDRDEIADLLDDAADAHLVVVERGAFTFAHALLRNEMTAGMSSTRRQRLHLRIATAAGAGGGSEQLVLRAAHLVAAGAFAEPSDVVDACRAAALDAEQRWLSDTAAHWWGQAVDTADRVSTGVDRDELVIAQVAALARAGRGQTVLDVLDAALLDAVRRGRLDAVGRLASALLRTSGSWPWAVYGADPGPLLDRLTGVETLVGDDPAAHVSVLAALAVGSCYDSDPAVPDALSWRAVEIAESLDDPDALADALLGRVLAFAGVAGRAAESIALLARLSVLDHRSRQVDDVIAHGAALMAELALGHPGAAQHLHLGKLGSDLLRLPTSRVQFRWAEGMIALWQGEDLAQAEVLFDRAFQLHRRSELYQSGVFDVAVLCVRWEQGRLADGEYPAAANPRVVPWAAAICAVAAGSPDADALITAELDRVEPPIWTTHGRLTMLAHAVADAGLVHHCAELAERLAPYTGGVANIGEVGVAGPVDLALARLALLSGDPTTARRHLSTARAVAQHNHAGGSLLRCRLLAEEIDRHDTGRADTARLDAIAEEARRRGMLGIVRSAGNLRTDR